MEKEKFDIYEMINNKIIDLLEQGNIPWHQPWVTQLPISERGRQYRGINIWLLQSSAAMAGYKSNVWLTYNRAQEMGGNIIPTESKNFTVVILWQWVIKKNDDDGSENKFPFLRYYRVYNYEQTENLPERKLTLPEIQKISSYDAVYNNMSNKPKLIENGVTGAYYIPTKDEIHLPAGFKSTEGFYATFWHELIHSTGHPDRLGRFNLEHSDSFGSERYSKEELIAELGSSYLCGINDILPNQIKNSAGYIQSWLKALKNDKRMIILSASSAQKAVDYILGKENYTNE